MTTDKDTLEEGTPVAEEAPVDTPETPQALYAGKYKTPEDLEKAYIESQKLIGKKAEEAVQLNPETIREMGFVTRDELAVEQEMQNFFTRYPKAKQQAEVFKTLKQSEKYREKSYDEIYNDLYPDTPSENKRIVREIIVGDVKKTYDKGLSEMSPEEIDKLSDDEIVALGRADSKSLDVLKRV